jgi:UDP-N-acetylglucosamine--N-acetylmuramyl-(pentapeptide) pyrophosphoryl-undecaprenol N-acetylglucosamine transferase
MKVLFTGGFTLGPVTPLLAVSEELRRQDPTIEVFWIGTYTGPERTLIAEYNIPFKAICSGKFRRYFSLRHIADNFHFICGFFQSFFYLLRSRPDVVVSAGGFVSVPVVVAGWFLGIPSFIHQQDRRPGLANRIMAPFASKITVAFKQSVKAFPRKKSEWVGNPVREDIFHNNRQEALDYFDLSNEKPVLFVYGGGTGAKRLNELVEESLPMLLDFCQVIHITGIGKAGKMKKQEGYRRYQFLTEGMVHAYDAADLVVSRAGMGALTELAALHKPSIIIPMPDTHQEKNAEAFENENAIQYVRQNTLNSERFVEKIKYTFDNLSRYRDRADNMSKVLPRGAKKRVAEAIIEVASRENK